MHKNVLSFLQSEGSIWASSDAQGEQILSVANAISAERIPELRNEWLARRHEEEDGSPLRTGPGGSSEVVIEDGIAVVPVSGVIAGRMNMFMSFSGGTSAEMLTRAINELADRQDIHTILLDIDSNGGSVHGLSIAAAAIRSAREKKRVISLAHNNMNSAAYYIGSAADRVFVTPTASIGSIGVLQILEELPEEEQERFTIVRSVPRKAKPNPLEPIDDESIQAIQHAVDKFHAQFVQDVALNRRMTIEQVTEMADGSVSTGSDAVQNGLADGVSSLDEIMDMVRAEESAERRVQFLTSSLKAAHAQIEDIKADLSAASAKLETYRRAAVSAQIDAVMHDAKAKLPAARLGDIRKSLEAGELDLNTFKATLETIPAGRATPGERVIKDADLVTRQENNSDLAPSTERERRMFAGTSLGANWKPRTN